MKAILTMAGLLWLAVGAPGDTTVTVYVDGARKDLRPQARVRDGVTYAPLRAACKAVGATVDWDASTRTATVSADGKTARIAKSQGIVVSDQLLIPLRLMSEALGAEVDWDGEAKAVRISTPRGKGGTSEGTSPPASGDEGSAPDEGTGGEGEGTG